MTGICRVRITSNTASIATHIGRFIAAGRCSGGRRVSCGRGGDKGPQPPLRATFSLIAVVCGMWYNGGKLYGRGMQMTAIKHIRIQNFTVFDCMDVSLSDGVNVIIGRNGTGKTQLLKLLYAGTLMPSRGRRMFAPCFGLRDGDDNLLRDKARLYSDIRLDSEEESHEMLTVTHFKTDARYRFECSMDLFDAEALPVVYIPVKDMLTHAKGLLAMADKYQDFPFDQMLLDIIRKANQWKLREVPELATRVLPHLEKAMDGQVVIENEEFYIKKHDGRQVKFSVEAEGIKKIGLLWQLLMNESITKGSLLLWDEPEANLNPDFFPVLVECLLELSRQGVQIVLSTHNYLFAKYFDVRRKQKDLVAYHSLYADETGAVSCETKPHFADLEHNAIMQTFDRLLDEVYHLQVGE